MEFYGFSQCGEMFRKLDNLSGDVQSHGQRKVGFEEDLPPFLQRRVRPVIQKHINIVPHWCTELMISWKEEGAVDPELGVQRPFECRSITRYRRAIIWVTPAAAGLSPRRRTEGILHELCHLQLAPLKRHIESVAPDNDMIKRMLVDQIEQTIESLVQAYLMKDDASSSFMRKFAKGELAEYDIPSFAGQAPVLSPNEAASNGQAQDP